MLPFFSFDVRIFSVLSIEANLKPVTEFFLERGYSLRDVGTMISKYDTQVGVLFDNGLSKIRLD